MSDPNFTALHPIAAVSVNNPNANSNGAAADTRFLS